MTTLVTHSIDTDRETAQKRLNQVMERLQKLQKEQRSSQADLERYLVKKTDQAIGALVEYLTSPEVVECFCKWNSDELPDVKDSWASTETAIHKLVQNRLEKVIEEWEEKERQFSEARRSVVTFFLEKYNYLEQELHNLEVNAANIGSLGHKTAIRNFFRNVRHSLPGLQGYYMSLFFNPVVAVASLLCLPGMLLSIPVGGIMYLKEAYMDYQTLCKYNKNRSDFVRSVSQKYIQEAATYKALKPLVENQLARAMTCLSELELKIPMLIEADIKLCQKLQESSQTKTENYFRRKVLYQSRKDKYEWLRGELGLFGAIEIRSMHIAWDDLCWDVSDDVDLKHPMEPGVYQGRICKGRYSSSRQVTLKAYKELLTSVNVTEFFTDEGKIR